MPHEVAAAGGPPRRPRRLRLGVAVVALAATLMAGCSALGLDSAGPSEVLPTTSAAAVAAQDSSAPTAPVTIGALETGTTAPRSTPTPWASLTTTAVTTTSEAPITALSTTKTLTFTTVGTVTAPTIVAPTSIASPPPTCYTQGTCRAQASASVAGGTIEIVNESTSRQTSIVFTAPGTKATALPVFRLTKPQVNCVGTYCLVQGSRSGLHFGSLVLVKAGALHSVSGTASSETAFHLLGASTPVVAGTYRFDSYGLMLDDAPVAARTWSISGGKLASTGCGQPYLYANPPVPTAATSGACTGTPQIAGYGPASANPLTSLSGFVTPSGNIQCGLLPNDRLVCGAKQTSIKMPTCTLSEAAVPVALRGLRVTVSRSGAVLKDNCIGYDLVGMPQAKIGYGRLAAARGFVCEVQEDGVTCKNPSGRGFSLSRSELSTF